MRPKRNDKRVARRRGKKRRKGAEGRGERSRQKALGAGDLGGRSSVTRVHHTDILSERKIN